MVMDSSKNGFVGRLTGLASIVTVIVFLLAGVGAFYHEINLINRNLDRNLEEIEQTCLSVRNLQVDLRFHMLNVPTTTGDKLPETPTIPIDC